MVGREGVVGCIFARLTNAFRGYCRSIRISRAAAFCREKQNARIRLIQYISGRIGRGRGSQSSILLTESSTLSGPPVIILGDHIARILTRERMGGRETAKERDRESSPFPDASVTPVFLSLRVYAFPVPVLRVSVSQLAILVRSSPTGVCAAATSLTLPSAGSGGRSRGRFSCTGAHRPPTGDPQYAANSHKAPADTQMDKRMDIRTSAPGLSRSPAKHRTPYTPPLVPRF